VSAAKKTPGQLDREIAAYATAGVRDAPELAAVMRRFRTQVSAYHREVAKIVAGSGDVDKARKIRDKLRISFVNEVAGYAPLSYRDPIVTQLNEELDALPSIADAETRGREARAEAGRAERQRIDDEIREINRPTEWMRPRGSR
jgi:hypothetical protein